MKKCYKTKYELMNQIQPQIFQYHPKKPLTGKKTGQAPGFGNCSKFEQLIGNPTTRKNHTAKEPVMKATEREIETRTEIATGTEAEDAKSKSNPEPKPDKERITIKILAFQELPPNMLTSLLDALRDYDLLDDEETQELVLEVEVDSRGWKLGQTERNTTRLERAVAEHKPQIIVGPATKTGVNLAIVVEAYTYLAHHMHMPTMLFPLYVAKGKFYYWANIYS
jgi:hypothetical protein